MDKSKKSMLTAVSSLLLTLINGIFSIVVIRLVIKAYGSDFNGLNSTVNQFINMLLVIEGGFTLATTVALFRPFTQHDILKINGILSASRKVFNKIGLFFLLVGTILSIVSVFFLKSDINSVIIFLSFFLTVLSTSFNLSYATKYKIILQTDQKEYISNFIQAGVLFLSQSLTVVFVLLDFHMLWIRIIMVLGTVITSLLIAYTCKKNYDYVNYYEEPLDSEIKGTKDLMMQKITGVIYGTIPVLFMSMTLGTLYVSVYIVYNNVFSLVKNLLYAVVNAPRMGLGKLIAEQPKKYVFKIFQEYEFIIVNSLLYVLTLTTVLIEPFISLYTHDIKDVNYSSATLALLLTLIAFFEIIHIPSGNIINMAGKFRIGKTIQTIAAVSLVISMVIFYWFFGFNGVLSGVLLTAILLAIMEIYYVYIIYFKESLLSYLKFIIPLIVISMVVVVAELALSWSLDSYLKLFVYACFIGIINMVIFILVNLIINRKMTITIFNRVKPLLFRK